MATPSIADWANFFIAQVGASASLAGLVIVAISINLARIITFPQLPGRAIETLAMLFGVLLISTFALIPGQPEAALGWEILASGAVMWLASVRLQILARGSGTGAKKWARPTRILLGQLTSLPFVIAGIVLVVSGTAGLYVVVPGVIFCLFAGVMNAWVLLVEINR